MSPLDERARRSSSALREAVDEAELRLLEAGLPRGGAGSRPALASRVLAFAGAFAVVLLGLGMAIVQLSTSAEESSPATNPPPAPKSEAPVPTTAAQPPPPTSAPAVPPPTPAPMTTVVDAFPPLLIITAPASGETVESELVLFSGITEPGATVARGKFHADVDTEGNWSLVLVVGEGTSTVTFTATDQAGNASSASVTVTYQPPEAPPTSKPLQGGFTASATYGVCFETPPYDVYYGSAAPGAAIIITSEFGGGSTVANTEGYWEAKVTFADAPYGETFLVTVKDDRGNKKVFEFTSLAG